MVPAQQENRNAGAVQARHLLIKEVPDGRVLPIAVVKITGDHDEVNAKLKSLENQLFHCFATSGGHASSELGIFRGQAGKRTAKMQVSCVDERKLHHFSLSLRLSLVHTTPGSWFTERISERDHLRCDIRSARQLGSYTFQLVSESIFRAGSE